MHVPPHSCRPRAAACPMPQLQAPARCRASCPLPRRCRGRPRANYTVPSHNCCALAFCSSLLLAHPLPRRRRGRPPPLQGPWARLHSPLAQPGTRACARDGGRRARVGALVGGAVCKPTQCCLEHLTAVACVRAAVCVCNSGRRGSRRRTGKLVKGVGVALLSQPTCFGQQ